MVTRKQRSGADDVPLSLECGAFRSPLLLDPIGFFSCPQKFRYETPRQGVFAEPEEGIITLRSHRNFEQALTDLGGFDRIWVIYQFHLNPGWKPMVRPPRHLRRKVGVFATRSPHRPNPLGLTCLRLLRIEGLRLIVTEYDLLDGTPIFDIKPYLAYADAFPDAARGWTQNHDPDPWTVVFDSAVKEDLDWLLRDGGLNLRAYARLQLQHEPENGERKRIATDPSREDGYCLSYRTWRLFYLVEQGARVVRVDRVGSGYRAEDLASDEDPYEDKDVHRRFLGRPPR